MFPFLTEVVLFMWNRLDKRSDCFLIMSKSSFEIADVFMQNKDSEFIKVLISLLVKIKSVVYVIVYVKIYFKNIGPM